MREFPITFILPSLSYRNTVARARNHVSYGTAQKNFVDRIMTIVRTRNNGGSFKKVIIELANESVQGTASLNTYLTWHKTVAKWVKDKGKYMVAVNPGPDHNGTTKYFLDCLPGPPGSCPTTNSDQYLIVFYDKVDLHSLHGGAWGDYPSVGTNSPCKIAREAQRIFNKPVIINDDGGVTADERNTNSTVYVWANGITYPNCPDPDPTGLDYTLYPGMAHLEHLEEGNQPDPAPVDCTPDTEPPAGTVPYIDCGSYDKLGNVDPFSDFCSIASSTCPALKAPPQYCVANCYSQ